MDEDTGTPGDGKGDNDEPPSDAIAPLPDVGPQPWGHVLAVHPPDRYVVVERQFGNRPSVVHVEPNGMVVSHGLELGTYRSRAGLLFWLRRSAKGQWYASVLAGGKWRYVGQKPFPAVAGWERLSRDRPWCRRPRCRAPLTDVDDLRIGLCPRCAWEQAMARYFSDRGEPSRAELREVPCPTCGAAAGDRCEGLGPSVHIGRRDAFLAERVGVPA